MIFLLELGIWIWIISVLRKRHHKHKHPKFKLVLLVVVFIALVCAFAGIQPLTGYKDVASEKIVSAFQNIKISSEPELTEEYPAEKLPEEIEEATPPKVISIQKTIHTGLYEPPGIKIDTFVTLERTSGAEGRYWYVTLLSENEDFGTEEIFWNKEMRVATLSWNIPSNTNAFTQLQLDIPCIEIFEVKITPAIESTEPIPEVPETDIMPEDKMENNVKNGTVEPEYTPSPTFKTGIVGRWQDTKLPNQYIEFFETGRVMIDAEGYLVSGTYELIGDEYIKLYLEGFAAGWAAMMGADTLKYYISGDILTISVTGKSEAFRRVE